MSVEFAPGSDEPLVKIESAGFGQQVSFEVRADVDGVRRVRLNRRSILIAVTIENITVLVAHPIQPRDAGEHIKGRIELSTAV